MREAIVLLLLSAHFSFAAACDRPGSGSPGARSSATAAASGSASAAASPSPPTRAVAREGSTIARAPEDDALFIVDEDHRMVHVISLPLGLKAKPVDIQVPGAPAQLIATAGRVLVTLRQIGEQEGALLVLRRATGLGLEEAGRVTLPADAWGIALSPDEKTALVSSAWTHTLSAIDVEKLAVRWSVDVAREPRGIVILPSGDRAYLSHLVGAEVTRVDGITGMTPTLKRIELPAAPLRSPWRTRLPASLGYAAVASPSGDRVFFARHALGALGRDAWFGMGAVDVLLTATDTPLAPPRLAVPTARFLDSVAEQHRTTKYLDGAGITIDRASGIEEPRAIVYRARSHTILVANEGSDSVVELDARAMDPTLSSSHQYRTGGGYERILRVPEHGGAPSGIALSANEDKAYVFCRSTYDVVALDLDPDEGSYRRAPPLAVKVAADENKQLSIGRRLFYKGDEWIMSTGSGNGLSCAGCHPEGRDDGHVWHEVNFTLRDPFSTSPRTFTNFFGGSDLSAIKALWDVSVEGSGGLGAARQTPMLAGRVKARGPYGWRGESIDLPARIIAGFDLHRWGNGSDNATMKKALANYLSTFLRDGLVPPPRVARGLSEEERRGKAIFESPASACATCHAPQTDYGDRAPAPLRRLRPPAGFVEEPNAVFRTPSLLYVGGTPPYLHDGRFDSLDALIEHNQDRMGKTAQLTAEDKKALVAFLKTL